MPLTVVQIQKAQPREKVYSLTDGQGLSLLVEPSGNKGWRFRYRFDGKARLMSLGSFPDITLAEAREKRNEARKMVSSGVDPVQAKRDQKLQRTISLGNSFEAIALEWHAFASKKWSEGYTSDVMEAFKADIFPYIGSKPVAEAKPMEWLAVFRRMESRGALEKMRKVRQRCGEVYRYAIATGRCEFNAVADLGSALHTPKMKHYPSLTPAELPGFMQALDQYAASPLTKLGLNLVMLTGLRPGELRAGLWAEIDFDQALWSIPAERMKKRRPHLVPLSSQALVLLRELEELTGRFALMFPGRNDPKKPMSEAAMNQGIKRMGFEGKVVPHGFRHTMSTILHEQGFESVWVETQLAHVDKNTIRGIYNHAQYLEGRRGMMQWYADHLDRLKREGAWPVPR